MLVLGLALFLAGAQGHRYYPLLTERPLGHPNYRFLQQHPLVSLLRASATDLCGGCPPGTVCTKGIFGGQRYCKATLLLSSTVKVLVDPGFSVLGRPNFRHGHYMLLRAGARDMCGGCPPGTVCTKGIFGGQRYCKPIPHSRCNNGTGCARGYVCKPKSYRYPNGWVCKPVMG